MEHSVLDQADHHDAPVFNAQKAAAYGGATKREPLNCMPFRGNLFISPGSQPSATGDVMRKMGSPSKAVQIVQPPVNDNQMYESEEESTSEQDEAPKQNPWFCFRERDPSGNPKRYVGQNQQDFHALSLAGYEIFMMVKDKEDAKAWESENPGNLEHVHNLDGSTIAPTIPHEDAGSRSSPTSDPPPSDNKLDLVLLSLNSLAAEQGKMALQLKTLQTLVNNVLPKMEKEIKDIATRTAEIDRGTGEIELIVTELIIFVHAFYSSSRDFQVAQGYMSPDIRLALYRANLISFTTKTGLEIHGMWPNFSGWPGEAFVSELVDAATAALAATAEAMDPNDLFPGYEYPPRGPLGSLMPALAAAAAARNSGPVPVAAAAAAATTPRDRSHGDDDDDDDVNDLEEGISKIALKSNRG